MDKDIMRRRRCLKHHNARIDGHIYSPDCDCACCLNTSNFIETALYGGVTPELLESYAKCELIDCSFKILQDKEDAKRLDAEAKSDKENSTSV